MDDWQTELRTAMAAQLADGRAVADGKTRRAYLEREKVRIAATRKAYREANQDRVREWLARWRKANQDKVREARQIRRAREVNAAGTHTDEQWLARRAYYGNRCIYCRSTEKIQVEHRIPLSRGGSNWPANLAPACKTCNLKKNTKTEREHRDSLKIT